MRLVLANHSTYPRVGDSHESQRVRRAYAARETGRISDEEYRDVTADYIAEIVTEQADAGLDLVTDGQIHWYDLIAHPARALEGVGTDGLVRFFDTNYLVRRAEVTGRIRGRFGIDTDYAYAETVSSKPVKPVITGPYTLARHSVLQAREYADVAALTLAYAEALTDELRALAQFGADVVQIEEPSLLRFPDDAPLVKRALERAVSAKGSRLRVSLVTYFGDAAPVYSDLLEMPVEMLGFDLSYGPRVVDEIIANGADRPLALGVVDGRNTKPDPVSVAKTIGRVAATLDRDGVQELHLQPSCGLEYLPRDRAVAKLVLLRQIGDIVAGGVR